MTRRTRRPQGDQRAEAREIELVLPEYQPSQAELEADARVPATFEQALAALVAPVRRRFKEPRQAE